MHPSVQAMFQDDDPAPGASVLCVVEAFHDVVLRVRHLPLAQRIDVLTGSVPSIAGLHRVGGLSVLVRLVPARRARLQAVERTVDLFRVVAILLGVAFGGYAIVTPPRVPIQLMELPDRGHHFLFWEAQPRRSATQRSTLGAWTDGPAGGFEQDQGTSPQTARAPIGPGPAMAVAETWQGPGVLEMPRTFDPTGLERVVAALQAGERPSARIEDLVNGLGLPGAGVHSAWHPREAGRLVVRIASSSDPEVRLAGIERVRLLGHTSGWTERVASDATRPMTWVLLVDPDGTPLLDGVPLQPVAWVDAPRSLRAAFVATQLGEWLQGAEVDEAWTRSEAERVLDASRPGEARLLSGVRAAWSGS